MITVFTPTYNRAYIITKLFESLKEQEFKDFEWLIVDDGSFDGTELLFEKFKKEDIAFEIRYYKKENGGKHRAINYGLELANGELFFIVDSDDSLPKDSLKKVMEVYSSIKNKEGFAGVVGTKFYSDGNIVGKTFDGDFIDATALERKRYSIIGDKAEVFITSVLRKYPFPEFEGENFISEGIVWNKIASDGYKMRWFNHNIYKCNYLEDGLTNNLRNNYRKNPKGYLTYVKSEADLNKISFLQRLNWYGKCISTIDKKDRQLLSILSKSKFVLFLSRCVYLVYKLIKRNRGDDNNE